jgi:exodeoxyribonuclease VII small subunit
MDSDADRGEFEAQLKDLEGIVVQLESGSLPLEGSLAAFERGVGLVRQLMARLDDVERRVDVLLRESGGDGLSVRELREEET